VQSEDTKKKFQRFVGLARMLQKESSSLNFPNKILNFIISFLPAKKLPPLSWAHSPAVGSQLCRGERKVDPGFKKFGIL
jgi:hypothetical protein